MTVLALLGWSLAVVAAWKALRSRRRLELVVRAEHELRGSLTVACLALESLGRDPACLGRVEPLISQVGRIRLALADLTAARSGRRSPPIAAPVRLEPLLRASAGSFQGPARALGREVDVSWHGGAATVEADPARLAQVFDNLLANALEHGAGAVELRGKVHRGALRVEVRDAGAGFARATGRRATGRGRGLGIVAEAVAEAGGTLRLESSEAGARAVVDLPLAERPPSGSSVGTDSRVMKRASEGTPVSPASSAGSPLAGTPVAPASSAGSPPAGTPVAPDALAGRRRRRAPASVEPPLRRR